ncbi:MAG: FAD-binding protein, partial [Candidatus Pacebacteria bacterium]|nr:FAD-binding protein [Candidatus Paceibacterota bacterium]
MKILEGRSLKDLTTFRIGGPARFFAVVKNKEDLIEAVDFAQKKSLQICIIGAGSNILVSYKGFDGLVIKM